MCLYIASRKRKEWYGDLMPVRILASWLRRVRKKEMTVNDVVFMLYKKNASDNDFVSNTLRAQNVSLTNGEEVRTELIDLNVLKFDPDFFKLEGDKLMYIGQTGNVTLYMNTMFNFVFVESAENPLTTNVSYPEVLFVNGWGIGRPELGF